MIICAGEALIDMLPREGTGGEAMFLPVCGGSVFNTAIALGRLGAQAGLVSGVSTDMFGEQLVAGLEASKVSPDLLIRSPRPTTLAFVRLTDGQAEYAFFDEGSAGRMIRVKDLPALPRAAKALFFGGISLAVKPCCDTYFSLMKRHSKSKLIMMDVNVRPDFIPDEAEYRARTEAMLAHTDILKLSDEDLRWMFGGADPAAHAEELLAKGPKMICVTEGAKGVTAYLASGAHTVLAERVEVVDTVGAGDTFNAGVLAGLDRAGALSKKAVAEGLPKEVVIDALRLGVKAAAVTVQRAGANPPWAGELA
ncbi:carbohydrate kinase [Vannielia litorea]|uniref:carbohydrate kinase family protein n=1 Tax=Vannielia litorea TaxID=1217970 RepID=UPI001C954754|nr:carbohydrate kinase [Vannielia litorea]MBY6152109.1 carbohydrate kinase [Vannielia litorea]